MNVSQSITHFEGITISSQEWTNNFLFTIFHEQLFTSSGKFTLTILTFKNQTNMTSGKSKILSNV